MSVVSSLVDFLWFLLLNIEHKWNMKCVCFKQYWHSLHMPMSLWGFERSYLGLLHFIPTSYLYFLKNYFPKGAEFLAELTCHLISTSRGYMPFHSSLESIFFLFSFFINLFFLPTLFVKLNAYSDRNSGFCNMRLIISFSSKFCLHWSHCN